MTSRVGTAHLSAVLLAIAGGSALALDAVGPGAGPLVQPVSSFVHTPYAWLWRTSVGAAAAALLSLAWTLRGLAARIFVAMLVVAGLGFAVADTFDTDLWFAWQRPPTVGGAVHLAAVLVVLVALAVAMTLRARSLPHRARHRWLRVAETAYGLSLLGAMAYLGGTMATGRTPRLVGACERLALASALLWLGLLSAETIRCAPDAGP